MLENIYWKYILEIKILNKENGIINIYDKLNKYYY